jgi:hypothetical protein
MLAGMSACVLAVILAPLVESRWGGRVARTATVLLALGLYATLGVILAFFLRCHAFMLAAPLATGVLTGSALAVGIRQEAKEVGGRS